MKSVSDIDLAYIAGFIDGEGTVSLKKNGQRWPTVLPYILITNTNLEILQWIQTTIGMGNIHSKNRQTLYWKEAYVLRLQTKDTKDFIKIIYPFLKLKRKQAELILKFLHIGSALGNPENKILKFKYLKEMQLLNKRGPE